MLLLLPALLVVTLSATMIDPSTKHTKVRQLQILSAARQQLIAYAAAYLESYKPTGAGPGHLPCPDTDQTPDEYYVQAGLRGDGPNPPCGKHAIAIGKLPRHISHGKHRYAFHLEDKHALWYAVDTRFINNPINRAVNPETVGRIHFTSELSAAAVVFIPIESSPMWKQPASVVTGRLQQAFQGGQGLDSLKESIFQYVLITPMALLSAVSQRVALWLHEQYQVNDFFACASNKLCEYAVLRSCGFAQRDRMLLLILDNTTTIKCDGTSADRDRSKLLISDARLDDVFLQRHWFYRNDWWRFVDIKIDDGCLSGSADCSALASFTATQQPIQLHVNVR